MDPVRLRLDKFLEAIRESENRETVRSIIARDEAPFSPERAIGKQRTYDGADLFAWALYRQLRSMGVPATVAAIEIQAARIVEAVFNVVDQGAKIVDLVLLVERDDRVRQSGQSVAFWGFSLQRLEDLPAILIARSSEYGTPSTSGDARLGLTGATLIPILPCLERCEAGARDAGFVMQGRNLYAVA